MRSYSFVSGQFVFCLIKLWMLPCLSIFSIKFYLLAEKPLLQSKAWLWAFRQTLHCIGINNDHVSLLLFVKYY